MLHCFLSVHGGCAALKLVEEDERDNLCIAWRIMHGETCESAWTGSALTSISFASSSLSIMRTRSCSSESSVEQTLDRTRLRHASRIDGADVGVALT